MRRSAFRARVTSADIEIDNHSTESEDVAIEVDVGGEVDVGDPVYTIGGQAPELLGQLWVIGQKGMVSDQVLSPGELVDLLDDG